MSRNVRPAGPETLNRPKGSHVFQGGIAVSGAGCAFLLCFILRDFLQDGSAYIIFLAAVAVVTIVSGFIPSLVTLFVGLLLTHWFFLEPPYKLHLASINDWVSTFCYLIVGIALASSSRSIRKRNASFVSEDTPQIRAAGQKHDEVKQQELEKQLAASKAVSAEAVQQLDAFAYTVSHDLRAPLRAIKGFTIALREDYDRFYDDEGKHYARRTVDATERLEQMLTALLAYSRLGRGEVPLMKVELESCLAKLSRRWSAEAQAKGGKIEIVGPLPAVIGNPPLLEQALDHFLSNSFKFLAPNTPPHVKIHSEQSEGIVRLKLTDNGIGIEKKHLPKLFQVFQHFNPVDAYPGLGIGLAMARKAAEKMGGRVGAQSQPGKGSCFWIELPKTE